MPSYDDRLNDLRQNHFLDPIGANLNQCESLISSALRIANAGQGNGPLFGDRPASVDNINDIFAKQVPQIVSQNLTDHLQLLPELLRGSVKSNHPRMVKNVVPTPTLMYLASYVAASIYMGNAVTAEDAGAASLAEIKISRIYAEMAGYDPLKAGGIFTFGGTGTNMYAFRMGILEADPDSILNGAKCPMVVIGSRPAHYSHQNAVSWLGLGRSSYLMARSNLDQTTNLDDLDRLCRTELDTGKRIACIVGVGGTTSCMGIDNFQAISMLIDKLIEDYALEYRPHLHADSVIGWAYLYFVRYDYGNNPLGFRTEVLQKLATISKQISSIKYADTFGIDFHKTGYTPYVSSMLISRSSKKLAALGRESDMMTPLFHDKVAYNPGKFTLETSRSSANIVATLMSVSSLGVEGFQTLLGHAQEIAFAIKEYVRDHFSDLHVVNPTTNGSDIFIRAYPPCISSKDAFATEMIDSSFRNTITKYNDDFFAFLAQECSFGLEAIAVSKTSAAFYTEAGDAIVALRIYVLNPFVDTQTAHELVDALWHAKNIFDNEYGPEMSVRSVPSALLKQGAKVTVSAKG